MDETLIATLEPAANMLYRMEPLRKSILQEIITFLHLPLGSRGLDVGCGIGLQTLQLARAVGPGGHVTGLDASVSFLETAKWLARQADLTDQVSFLQGSWSCIPYKDSRFDWAWSVDAAGYAPYEPISVIQELARVVKPGGSVHVGFWSSQSLLPGYPVLEARLNASAAGIAPFQISSPPKTHFMRALGWFHAVGLVDARAETFVQNISAPLDNDLREALSLLLEMRWGTAPADVSSEDWLAYQQLCHSTSPDFVLDSPDYNAFFTYTVFSGRVPVC